MSELQVVLNAKNKASEVLRAVGQDIRVLQDGVTEFGAKVQEQSSKIDLSFNGIAAATAAAAAATVAVVAAIGAASYAYSEAQKSLKQFDASTQSVEKLSKALELNGTAASDTSDQLRKLANQIEAATNIDANKITDIQSSAFAKGIDADKIGQVTKAAVGLAEAFGTDLAGGLDKAVQASKGNFDAFTALIPGIKQMVSVEEKLAAVSLLASKGLDIKTDSAAKAQSVFERMNVQMNNVYESVGKLLSPFRQLTYEGIAVAAEYVNQLLIPSVEAMQKSFSVTDSMVASMAETIGNSVVAAFTAAQVSISNFDQFMNLAVVSVELSLVTLEESFKHTFGVAIPQYLEWFVDNSLALMVDSMTIAASLAEGIGNKIGEQMAAYYLLLQGKMEQASDARIKAMSSTFFPGFEQATKELPEIAARAVSDTEKQLMEQLDKITGSIAKSYTDTFESNIKSIRDALDKKPFDAKIDLKIDKDEIAKLSQVSLPINQAVESRILVRGPGENPAIQTAANTKVIAEQAKITNTKLDALNKVETSFSRSPRNQYTVGYDERFSFENQVTAGPIASFEFVD